MPHPAHNTVLSARTLEDRLADVITQFSGSMTFVYLHAAVFAVWILTQGFGVDAFPFNFLTMAVSLEAIFLSTFVMISQNRQAALQSAQADHDHKLLKRVAEHLGVE